MRNNLRHDELSANDAHCYASPRTHEALVLRGDGISNAAGTERFPFVHGLPSFLAAPSDPYDEEQLLALCDVARTRGWEAALDELQRRNSKMHKYVTDKSRLLTLEAIPLQACHRVLEIGCGFGQFTFDLANKCQELYVLEVVPGQAAFVAIRALQEQRANIHVAIGGDDCRLPYRDQSFDLIFMNLVFEWCASRIDDGDRVACQALLLQECFRVLRPAGGMLYLATKNRFALRLLLGLDGDEHAWNMRFGSALPRWALRWILALRRKGQPPGILHSYRGLRQMLVNAGFTTIESYWAAPEMRYPMRLIRTDGASIRNARMDKSWLQGERKATRLLMPWVPAPWVKHVAPGLAFLATKK